MTLPLFVENVLLGWVVTICNPVPKPYRSKDQVGWIFRDTHKMAFPSSILQFDILQVNVLAVLQQYCYEHGVSILYAIFHRNIVAPKTLAEPVFISSGERTNNKKRQRCKCLHALLSQLFALFGARPRTARRIRCSIDHFLTHVRCICIFSTGNLECERICDVLIWKQ